ncbi:DUF456 domain-containing protein [Peribacillus frigoritolerans]|nr:DUF456 domain-containing protein [Peribacillus frigoritolerans]
MGGQKTSETIAAIATIVGSFVFPPFGIILVPFLAVLVFGIYHSKRYNEGY